MVYKKSNLICKIFQKIYEEQFKEMYNEKIDTEKAQHNLDKTAAIVSYEAPDTFKRHEYFTSRIFF